MKYGMAYRAILAGYPPYMALIYNTKVDTAKSYNGKTFLTFCSHEQHFMRHPHGRNMGSFMYWLVIISRGIKRVYGIM